jgi:hypothetical protein
VKACAWVGVVGPPLSIPSGIEWVAGFVNRNFIPDGILFAIHNYVQKQLLARPDRQGCFHQALHFLGLAPDRACTIMPCRIAER